MDIFITQATIDYKPFYGCKNLLDFIPEAGNLTMLKLKDGMDTRQMSFFVPISQNWSWNPSPARAGRLSLSLSNSMAFFHLGRIEE